MRGQQSDVRTNRTKPIFISLRRVIAIILGGVFLSISMFPLVHSISISEHPHFISLVYKNSGQIIPLLFMDMFNESYRTSYEKENDSSDIHTLINKMKLLHNNIFVVRLGKTLGKTMRVAVNPSEEYLSKKSLIKMLSALLPASFWLIIGWYLHNTSPPL